MQKVVKRVPTCAIEYYVHKVVATWPARPRVTRWFEARFWVHHQGVAPVAARRGLVDALGFLAEPRAKRLRCAMAINFTQPRPNNRKYLKQVTSWVEDALPDSMDDVTVMVNEMQCFEPDCAPLETVITLLGQKSIVFKVFKPVAEVLPEEALSSLRSALAGNQTAQHINQSAQHDTPMDTPMDTAMAMVCEES